MRRKRFLQAVVVLAAALWVPAGLSAQEHGEHGEHAAGAGQGQDGVVVYLVRHAEKVDDSRDPALSEAGKARAGRLAAMLRDAGITHVWSTDYQRTRHTAEPVARAASLTVELYDPRDPAGLATKLKATPGRHLVVGHSNTTPGLVEALGGDPRGTIADDEYDRLYLVVVQMHHVTSTLIRYGGN